MSSSSTRSRNNRGKSSRPIDDDIYRCYSNSPIFKLVLGKERDEPGHEFVIVKISGISGRYYRIERRPSEGTDISSMLHGCEAEDTITPLNENDYEKVEACTDNRILVLFRHDPMPDLHTVLDICNAIRKDPDTEKYTLMQFNCYFFARTLTLLITRHFLLRLSCRIHKSPRNDFGSLSEPEIDAIVDQAEMPTRVPCTSFIRFDLKHENHDYKDLRQYILEMNIWFCKMVGMLGANGDVLYDTLDKKKEEIWRRMHSNPTTSERRVDLDWGLEFRAMGLFGKDVKEMLLTRALLRNDISLLRYIQAL